MKLRNKLIPLISVAATAAAVTPLASCGMSLSMDMIDVLHGYTPTTTRAEARTKLTADEAKELYVDHVKKNPQIFAEDLAWWEGQALKQRINYACYGKEVDSETYENPAEGSLLHDIYSLYNLELSNPAVPTECFTTIPQIANFGVSDLSIGETKLVNPDTLKEEKFYTISCKFNFEFQFELNADCASGSYKYQVKRVTSLSLTSEYKDIPFTLMWDSSYATWRVLPLGWFDIPSMPTLWMLQKHQNWFFNFDLKSNTTDTIKDYQGNVDTFNYDESRSANIDTYAKALNWMTDQDWSSKEIETAIRNVLFNFGSYHMFDIMGPEWGYTNLGNYDSIGEYNVGEDQVTMTFADALNYNWSYADIRLGAHPVIGDQIELVDDSVEFDVYNKKNTTTPQFKIKFNKGKLLPNYEYGATYPTSFQTPLKATMIKSASATEDLPGTLNTFRDNYYFVVPKDTTFSFKINFYNEATEEASVETKQVKLGYDIKMPWSATNTIYSY